MSFHAAAPRRFTGPRDAGPLLRRWRELQGQEGARGETGAVAEGREGRRRRRAGVDEGGEEAPRRRRRVRRRRVTV